MKGVLLEAVKRKDGLCWCLAACWCFLYFVFFVFCFFFFLCFCLLSLCFREE